MNPMQLLLHAAFEQHAARPALRDATIALDYAGLDRASAALARCLQSQGVRAGDVVPLCMARSALLVLAEVALLRIGAAYAPIDPASPAARRRLMLRVIAPALILTDSPTASPIDGATLDVAAWWPSRAEDADDGADAPPPWLPAPESACAYVMFTSGSTGVPKGVQVPESGIVRLVHDARHAHFGPEQRWAFLSSPAFDACTLEVWGALLNGGCCVVHGEALPSLDVLAGFLVEQRITDAWLTSALFNAMVEDQLPALGGLQQLLTGGERVSPAHARRMLIAHPSTRLINGYGPTENTTFTLCHTITLADTEGDAGVPIGLPLRGTGVRIEPIDAAHADVGELWTTGAGLALGYLGDAEATQRKFVRYEGQRWYRTGDIVRREREGPFSFVGRTDSQVKLRGHRVELEEVELALTRCAGVGDAAVLVRGDAADTRRLVAVVRALGDAPPDPAALAAALRELLPEPSVPSAYLGVRELPRTLNGKLDRRALEALWVAHEAERAAPVSLVERLQRVFATHAARPAIEGLSETLSYAELEQRSEALAAHLLELGVRPGDALPLFLPRSSFLVVAMLAAVRIGAPFVPIDLASPPARVARILALLRPRFALTDSLDGPLETEVLAGCIRIDRSDLFAVSCSERRVPWAATPPDAPLYIMFTSGSTGAPKGVVVPSRGLMALVGTGGWADFPADARWLLVTSPAFDISHVELWGALLHGACCVVQEGELPSLDELARLLVARRITHAQMSTALFNAMVDTQLASFAGLAQFITGGERASPPHMRACLLAHPQLCLINGYGPTETTIYSTTHPVTLADTHDPAGVPIGRPVQGTFVRVEPDDGVTDGAIGELLIAGAGVAIGYLNDPAQTALRFVERDGRRWYRSGDLVRERADGTLAYHGRADAQVKLQGQRIEIDEVELTLAACPGVGEVVVLLRGDDAAHRHLAACYSGLAGAAPDPEQVSSHLAAHLPAAALPKEFRRFERLPRNLNGKIDREALAKVLDASLGPPTDASAAAPAHGEIEAGLAAIWSELLPQVAVTRDSHFLRIGGTSLLALHAAALVQRRLGRVLPPVEVLRHPLLADLARVIAQLPRTAPGVQASDTGNGTQLALTRNQQGLLAASRLDASGCAYLVHVALHLRTTPPASSWRAAFEQLAQRHPALRLSAWHDGLQARATLQPGLSAGWWQEHAALDTAPLDLAWPDALLASINRPLDTRAQGSMRADFWPLRDGGALVVWTVHHHVIDEASIATALAEFDALLQGRSLAPVYGSPFAFRSIETAWTDPAPATTAWAARLAHAFGGAAALELAPAPGQERRFELAPALQRALAQACATRGCTPFTLLLAAYGQALQAVFGARRCFVSTPFSRRVEPDLTEPIGYLIDPRFIEAGARADETPHAMLARIHEAVLQGQRPAFQPLDALSRAVAEIDPPAAQRLNQFGFTWRIDPAGPVPIAGHAATLLRVPQRGARYALCLHAARLAQDVGYSIEAVESAHRDGHVAAVARAFERHLAALCELHPMPPAAASADDDSQPVPAAKLADAALRAAWSRWLEVPAAGVQADSHFLRSGGSSLTAMRLAAGLRRDHGLQLDVGAFLADPTFSRLSALSTCQNRTRPADCVLLGPDDFAHVMLLVPGAGGQVASLYALADELRRRLPARTAVAIVDLDAVLRHAPADAPLWHVSRRIVQIVRDLGAERVTSLVGYSLGALLLLQVAGELRLGPTTPVWLLDAFSPRFGRRGFWRRLERRLAWTWFGGAPAPGDAAGADSKSARQTLPAAATDAQWHRLGEQLSACRFDAPNAQVHLIQARQNVARIGLLWRRRHNGFAPNEYASWQVHTVEGDHLDLPRHLAATTAGLMVARGRR